MPLREDIRKVAILGSGPIVIGQACEFDYSGTQACRALREEGLEVVLVNPNPATIMTDPETADRTYVEPITAQICEQILERERPDALLPTLGGQTALNASLELDSRGVLERLGVRLIGASVEAIRTCEEREAFKVAAVRAGLEVPLSAPASAVQEAAEFAGKVGFPVIVRPYLTLGGWGGGVARDDAELAEVVSAGLRESPQGKVLVEECLLGWKEYELEVMRDALDNCVIVCSIENVDPMGVHTGDSITVAPAQTLTDKCYQRMRDGALAIMREVGLDTGGANVQFAVRPSDGRMVVIEMNPRVSRSSALASKATGFPIAKIAAKLAVGLTLAEIANDITKVTPVCFEPSIDYCVVKVPRWDFEKFPASDGLLGPSMRSVGEVMAIGRNFRQAFLKAMRSLESPAGDWLEPPPADFDPENSLSKSHWMRPHHIKWALERKMTPEAISELTGIDPWFVRQFEQLVRLEGRLRRAGAQKVVDGVLLREAKRSGFSDRDIGRLVGVSESDVRSLRRKHGVQVTMKSVDTCAAEFEAYTPYFYSCYEHEDEAGPAGAGGAIRASAESGPDAGLAWDFPRPWLRAPASRGRSKSCPRGGGRERGTVLVLGSGPNRIGQGIEFDCCCVQACLALRENGYRVVMMNSNPETVSTDYDISDRLYFEPLTVEEVTSVAERERPVGVIVQLGGQTPLKLAQRLEQEGVRILGTSTDAIDMAENRDRFRSVARELGLVQPANSAASSFDEALATAEKMGYPVLLRPSYVLGGRGMRVAYAAAEIEALARERVEISRSSPLLVEQFLEGAVEIEVDAVCDGETALIGAVMEHIEEAGVHSGDSSCVIPPYSVGSETLEAIREATRRLALRLGVVGLVNLQFAVKNDQVYVLEVNPRASRTVPFVSKATGVPLARIGALVMLGHKLGEWGLTERDRGAMVCVKKPVLPFNRFPGDDMVLGPEMRSTGEVMGIGEDLGSAFAKAQLGSGEGLPLSGTAFISVRDRDKRAIPFLAKKLRDLGFEIAATRGTAALLAMNGIEVTVVNKVYEGSPHVVDLIQSGKVTLVINTPLGRDSKHDDRAIRKAALTRGVVCVTTVPGATAAVAAIEEFRKKSLSVITLQELHALSCLKNYARSA